MSRRKTTKSKRGSQGFQLSPENWRRTWSVIGWSTAAIAIGWGLHAVGEQARAVPPRFDGRIQWTNLPPWLAQESGWRALEEVEDAASLSPQARFLAPDLTATVGANLQKSPWVASVDRVTKHVTHAGDGIIRVAATFRAPFAYVEVQKRAHLIDREGVRLPIACRTEYLSPEDAFVITGVAAPLPETGTQWPGEDLAAGLELVRFLMAADARQALPFRPWIRAVDVSNFDRQVRPFGGQLRINSVHPGCTIDWGTAPGAEFATQATAQRKLDMLNAWFAEHGELPAESIDVRQRDGIRPPLRAR
jgi:hypothetical protein